jgi:hypothetical protein
VIDAEVEDRLLGIPEPHPLEGRRLGPSTLERIRNSTSLVEAAQSSLSPLIGERTPATSAARDVRTAIENPGRGQSDPLPLPVPAEAALTYRRDQLAGIDQPPSQLANIGAHR